MRTTREGGFNLKGEYTNSLDLKKIRKILFSMKITTILIIIIKKNQVTLVLKRNFTSDIWAGIGREAQRNLFISRKYLEGAMWAFITLCHCKSLYPKSSKIKTSRGLSWVTLTEQEKAHLNRKLQLGLSYQMFPTFSCPATDRGKKKPTSWTPVRSAKVIEHRLLHIHAIPVSVLTTRVHDMNISVRTVWSKITQFIFILSFISQGQIQ